MSLLMQALKKAERAKQNHVQEDGLEKPSEAYDQILSLSPQEPAQPAAAAGLALEPADGLSLAPLADAAAPAPAPPQAEAPPA
ncbi:tetratricopeptide repeat protein, partial [Janthinobacterium sp. hw3]|nr:tetratricopeptide repeat protein [Janthinobacterium fluminis]